MKPGPAQTAANLPTRYARAGMKPAPAQTAANLPTRHVRAAGANLLILFQKFSHFAVTVLPLQTQSNLVSF